MKIIKLTLVVSFFNLMALQAQVPGTLSYQGILMQNDGITPIADGAHSIVFNFYTTSSGGAALFSRTISVTTTKGLYTCIIGGGIAPNAPFIATEKNQLGSQQIFIGIAVDGGGELLPRAQLTTSPYSFRSESVTQTANPAGGNVSFWGANNTLGSDAALFWDNANHYLGIGTSTPAGYIDLKGSLGNLRMFDYLLQFTRPSINYIHATSVGGHFYFTVNGNPDTNASMVIKANGNVGIGLTNPLERLHVVGNIFATGDAHFGGTLTKGSGTFKIDHPADPENKFLYHSFVESPDMMNVYNGNTVTDARGEVSVILPDYFESLNKDFRYQLTVIGTFAQAIVYKKIENNSFLIKTDKPHVEVSWQVTGIRKDPFAEKNRVIPVVDKTGSEKGKYLHPAAYGLPDERGIYSQTRKDL